MKYSQLVRFIKQNKWWSEEAPATYQSAAYPLHCFIEQSRYFHPKYASIAILIFKKDFFHEETPEDEKYKVYQYVYQKVKKDQWWLSKLREDYRKVLKRYYRTALGFKKNKDEMTDQELWRSYKSFMDEYLDSLRYAVGLECADIFTAYYLEGLTQKELPKLDEKEITRIILTLSTPLVLSFMEEERIDFLRICASHYYDFQNFEFKQVKGELLKKLKSHSQNYFWILNNFKSPKFLDEKYYFEYAKTEVTGKSRKKLAKELSGLETKIKRLKMEKRELDKTYSFSKELKQHFDILETMAAWIDERKKNMLIATHYLELYCQEISKRFGLDIWDIKYYLVDEIGDLILKNKKVNKELLRKRRKFSAYVLTRDGQQAKINIFYGERAEQIYNAIYQIDETKEIRGQVACAPISKIQGRVQVILDTTRQKFKEGGILVTSMTRPDFVPLMRRAKAVITDEGGLTCHAAIVSRELGIPCIIGTKIATRILKHGDQVEMDLNRGVVKKI